MDKEIRGPASGQNSSCFSKMIPTALLKISVILTLIPPPTGQVHYCREGEYVYTPKNGGPDICLQCPSDTFMPKELHTERKCYPCSKVANPVLERLSSTCNKTHDSEIQCILHGYFRRNGTVPGHDNGECLKCTQCNATFYPAQQCQQYSDAVCCPNDTREYDVAMENGRATCVKRPVLCGPGQYRKQEDNCFTCPDNTYMPYEKHTNVDCKECPHANLILNEVLFQKCNKTHPGTIVCKDNYYRTQFPADLLRSEGDCTICSACKKGEVKVKNCTLFSDTLCCLEADLFRNSSGELSCLSQEHELNSTVDSSTTEPMVTLQLRCGQNHFLYTDNSTNLTSCEPCPIGFFLNEMNHTNTICKNCTLDTGEEVPTACIDTHGNVKKDEGLGWKIGLPIVILVLIVVVVIVIIVYKRRKRSQEQENCKAGPEVEPLRGNAPA